MSSSSAPVAGPVLSFNARLVLVIAAILFTGLFALYWTPYAIDDSWITYRYAENLGAGRGFVYNPGERVLGTSTPLYTLLLAAAHVLGLSVPVTSYVIGYGASLLALIGVFLLGRLFHSERVGVLAVLLVLATPFFHRVATYGMETPLYVCLIVYAFYAWARGRELIGAALAALCLVTRLDGAAVGAAMFLAYLLEHRRLPWRAIGLFTLISAPWFAFSQWYFGAPVPNSFVAKRHHMTTNLQGWLLRWLIVRGTLVPAIVGGLAALFTPRRWAILPLALWTTAYVTAYTFSGIWRYEWYFMPMTVPLGIFAAMGIVTIADWFRGAERRMIVVAALSLLVLTPDLVLLGRQLQKGRYENRIESGRYEASLWMQAHLPGDAIIATGGIGMPGYFTGNYILDSAGLITPQVVGPVGVDFFLVPALALSRPEYVFLSRPDIHDFMRPDYVELQRWQTGDPDVPVYLLACRVPCRPIAGGGDQPAP